MRTWPAVVVSGLSRENSSTDNEAELLHATLVNHNIAAIDEPSEGQWRVFFNNEADRSHALTELRREFPYRSLCLLLGMDAFLGLPSWHRWRELFELAHVVVAHRPGWKAPTQGPLGELMVDRGTGAVNELHNSIAGRIYVHAVTQLEISSTELRQIIDAGRDPRFLVPDTVRAIIRESGCYARPR